MLLNPETNNKSYFKAFVVSTAVCIMLIVTTVVIIVIFRKPNAKLKSEREEEVHANTADLSIDTSRSKSEDKLVQTKTDDSGEKEEVPHKSERHDPTNTASELNNDSWDNMDDENMTRGLDNPFERGKSTQSEFNNASTPTSDSCDKSIQTQPIFHTFKHLHTKQISLKDPILPIIEFIRTQNIKKKIKKTKRKQKNAISSINREIILSEGDIKKFEDINTFMEMDKQKLIENKEYLTEKYKRMMDQSNHVSKKENKGLQQNKLKNKRLYRNKKRMSNKMKKLKLALKVKENEGIEEQEENKEINNG